MTRQTSLAWYRPRQRHRWRSVGMMVFLLVVALSWCSSGHGEERKARASFYSKGKLVACGGKFDPEGWTTAAHPRTKLACGSKIEVVNPKNGRKITLTVNDKGPWRRGLNLDLTLAAARALGVVRSGVFNVTYQVLPKIEAREPTPFELRFAGCQDRLDNCTGID